MSEDCAAPPLQYFTTAELAELVDRLDELEDLEEEFEEPERLLVEVPVWLAEEPLEVEAAPPVPPDPPVSPPEPPQSTAANTLKPTAKP